MRKQAIAISKGVQFNGKDAVLTAYQNRGLAPFALWCGRQFLFTYEDDDITEGADLLSGWLDNLQESAAIYTITVYKNTPENGITPTTEYSGSFNFKLQEKPVTYLGAGFGEVGGGYNHLIQELKDLRKEKADLQAEIAELEEENKELSQKADAGIVGMLGGMTTEILGSEPVKEAIATKIADFLGRILTPSAVGKPVKLAGINTGSWQEQISPAEVNQVNEALNILVPIQDINAVDLLQKLAAMAQKDIGQFVTYVGMFRNLAG